MSLSFRVNGMENLNNKEISVFTLLMESANNKEFREPNVYYNFKLKPKLYPILINLINKLSHLINCSPNYSSEIKVKSNKQISDENKEKTKDHSIIEVELPFSLYMRTDKYKQETKKWEQRKKQILENIEFKGLKEYSKYKEKKLKKRSFKKINKKRKYIDEEMDRLNKLEQIKFKKIFKKIFRPKTMQKNKLQKCDMIASIL